jgi:hypothetical protein
MLATAHERTHSLQPTSHAGSCNVTPATRLSMFAFCSHVPYNATQDFSYGVAQIKR